MKKMLFISYYLLILALLSSVPNKTFYLRVLWFLPTFVCIDVPQGNKRDLKERTMAGANFAEWHFDVIILK